MKIAVLLKQVPDSQSVRLDTETGTLIRDASDAVTNPLDLNALSAAVQLSESDPGSSITLIGMGPAGAERTMREGLALGAQKAVLICDRHCAGSDTLVTAKVLAAALAKFGPFDLVLAGVRATDGETGQVGPETAARLGIKIITNAESLTKSDTDYLESDRITETGLERIRFQLPALVTVTKGIGDAGLPTLAQKMRARREPITIITAADLGLQESDIGLSASPTRVVKIDHPVLTRRGTQITVTDTESLEQALCRFRAFLKSADSGLSDSVTESPALSPSVPRTPKKVAVFAETVRGTVSPTAFELLTRALQLASPAEITALFITDTVSETGLKRLSESGAGTVAVYESQRLASTDIETRSRVLETWCAENDPDVLLGAATVLGRTLFPYAAMRMTTGLTADCTSLSFEPETGLLLQTRPAIGGNVTATIKTPHHRPQMATVRPHSTPAAPLLQNRQAGKIERKEIPAALFSSNPPELISFKEFETAEDLADAERIVAVGKGIKRKQRIEDAKQLASNLGASLGATRELVDRGWLPYSSQIGLSGLTVSPNLYIALGISGAVQHLAGMRTAKKIAAVNIDPDAPIFQAADLGIVGDLAEIMPELLRITEQEAQKK